jgi:type I restriction enzyme S subunit
MKCATLDTVAIIDRTVASEEECETLPYVGLDDIEKEAGHFTADFERAPELLRATKFRFTPKHVLYGKLRPYLNKVALPSFDGVCTTEILPILPVEDRLDRTYLWAFLLTPGFVEWASSNVSGANLPRISPKLLAEYKIPLPPLPEQQRIAAILAKADRLRRLRRTARELSDTVLQSVFLEMFGDGNRFPSKKLGGLLLDSPKNGLYLPADKYGSGIPIIRINNFYGGILGDPAQFKRVQATQQQAEEFSVVNGEILINRVNSIEYLGKCALVQGLSETTLFESNMMRLCVDTETVIPIYLVRFLTSRQAYAQIVRRARKAVNQASINQQGVKSLMVPVPPLSRQQQFAHIVHRFERLRAQQREAERQAEHLFETLLERAFRGEVWITEGTEGK